MFTPLLTKFFAPQSNSSFLERTQLFAKLELGEQAGFSLVAAPAGYGKSSLVAQWLKSSQKRFVWLSLDADDNDAVQFWQYVIAAFQQLVAELGLSSLKALDLHKADTFQQVIHSLMNDLVLNYRANQQHLTLVLDDYHRIENSSIHKKLDGFIEKIPANVLHVIMISRADPPFALAKRRAKQQISELRAIDLRLSEEESLAFFKKLELNASSEALRLVTERSEGWLTGLQLAALSMTNKTEAEAFARKLRGDDRHIADYLIEEVLDHQTKEVQQFLLETAFLECLSAELCDSVRNQSNSREILEKLEQSNVFLIPLDNQRQFYRYHHLFADLLIQQAGFRLGDGVRSSSLAKAADWAAQQGSWFEAVRYAMAIKSTKKVANYLEKFAYTYSNWREIHTDWLDAAKEHFDEHPILYFAKANRLYLESYTDETVAEINALLKKAETLEHVQTSAKLKAHLYMLRITVSDFGGLQTEYANFIEQLTSVLNGLNEDDLQTEAQVCFWLGLIHHQYSTSQEAEYWLIRSQEKARAIHEESVYLTAGYFRCLAFIKSRDYADANAIALNVIDSASEATLQHPLMGGIYSIVGRYKMNQGRFVEAKGLLEEAQELVALAGDWGIHFNVILTLMSVYLVLGEQEKGLKVCKNIFDTSPVTSKIKEVQDRYFRLSNYLDNKELLDRWEKQHEMFFDSLVTADTPAFIWQVFSVALLVRLHILQMQHGNYENLNQDQEALDSLIEMCKDNPELEPILVRFALLKCLTYHAQTDQTKTLETLEFALNHCRLDKGYAWTLFEDRQILKPYLEQCLEENINPEFVNDVLTIYEELESSDHSEKVDYGDLEPLSEREMDVLKLIATGLSNKAVAKQLDLSPNTVRAHASNIYSKLTVQGRTEAVARATDIGLL